MRKTRKALLFVLMPLLLSALIIVGVMTAFPNTRELILDSPVTTAMVKAYNTTRPLLNIGNNKACLVNLPKRDIQFTSQSDINTELGCIVSYSVAIRSFGKAKLSSPALLTCRMTKLLADYLDESVQPAAQEMFGHDVVRIVHVGTYNCRPMRGHKRLLSEHAFANAIDVTGFVLADGTAISALKDWTGSDKKSDFLRRIAAGSCDHFPAALSPDYNALHRDHFHLDAGFYPKCG